MVVEPSVGLPVCSADYEGAEFSGAESQGSCKEHSEEKAEA